MPCNTDLSPVRSITSFARRRISNLFIPQMCCEQLECYVAVFDHKEASCYLKGAQAMNTYAFVEETGFSTHEMFFRGGMPARQPAQTLFSSFRATFVYSQVLKPDEMG